MGKEERSITLRRWTQNLSRDESIKGACPWCRQSAERSPEPTCRRGIKGVGAVEGGGRNLRWGPIAFIEKPKGRTARTDFFRIHFWAKKRRRLTQSIETEGPMTGGSRRELRTWKKGEAEKRENVTTKDKNGNPAR